MDLLFSSMQYQVMGTYMLFAFDVALGTMLFPISRALFWLQRSISIAQYHLEYFKLTVVAAAVSQSKRVGWWWCMGS